MRYIILCFLTIWVTACSAKDDNYYISHPKALQSALDNCPAVSPRLVECHELEQIATRMNTYAFAIQTNPKAFGVNILNLQEEIANQQRMLLQYPNDEELQKILIQTKKFSMKN